MFFQVKETRAVVRSRYGGYAMGGAGPTDRVRGVNSTELWGAGGARPRWLP